MRRTIVWVGVVFLGTGPVRGAADTTPEETAKILDASLRNVPDLAAVRVTGARPHPKDKGVLILRGTVPNETVRQGVEKQLPGILKNARESGALKGDFTADPSHLVDQSLSRDDQAAFVIRLALAELGGELVANIVSARVSADGAVRLDGWVAKEKWRAAAEKESDRALAEAVALKEIAGPFARVSAARVHRAPNALFRLIESSLENKNDPALRGRLLYYGEETSTGGYAVYGLVRDQATRRLLIDEIRRILKSSAPKSGELDDTGILVGTGAAGELRVLEAVLPPKTTDYVLIGSTGTSGKLALTGYVQADATRVATVERLERFVTIASVDDGTVVGPLAEKGRVPGLSTVSAALEKGDGPHLLEYGASWVRAGNGTHQSARDGWIIRAAGHIQLSEWERAAGAIRAAAYLEKQFPNANYALTIPRYQGPARAILDTFYRSSDDIPLGDTARDSATSILARARSSNQR